MGALSCSCTFPRIDCPSRCAQACDACHLARDAEHRAEIERLKGELAEAEAALKMSRDAVQAYCDSENTMRGELAEAKRVIAACAHVPCVLASMSSRTPWAVPRSCGFCGTCSARKQVAAPPPAESTPVQTVDAPYCANEACTNCSAIRARPMKPAPPDDIRARLERLEEWASMRERGPFRLAALEATSEPGTHQHYFSNDGKKRCEVFALPEDRPCTRKEPRCARCGLMLPANGSACQHSIRAPQPAPGSDEAKVREIISARKKTGESGDYLLLMTATDAYAAGKADGRSSATVAIAELEKELATATRAKGSKRK